MDHQLPVEPRISSFLFSKASRMNIPLSGTFELTPECNFRCRMCYVRKTHEEVLHHAKAGMTLQQWLRIAREARAQGMLYLLLTGGEPFLWPDFWDLYEELVQMGFLISINSNGSLITDTVIARLKKAPPVRINITLYGASDATYEALCGAKGVFHRVDEAIRGLKAAGILVKLNGSLTPYNVGDLEACRQYAKEQNLILETVSYMFPPLRRDASMVGVNDRFTPEEAAIVNARDYRLTYGEELYAERMKRIAQGVIPAPMLDEQCIDPLDGTVRCRAGRASFWITWDGCMTPCGMMPTPAVDITNQPFETAWKQIVDETAQMHLSGVCKACPDRRICHSCAAMALAETGSVSGIPKYLCEMTAAMRRHAISEIGKLDPV